MLANSVRKIGIVLIFAILVGCIYIYADIRLIHELKEDYQGIAMTATGDELLYLGMVNAFYKGNNFTLSGFDNYEHAGKQPWVFGFLPQVILGFTGKLLGITVTQLDILMSFLLPAVLFILIYSLTFRLSRGSFCLAMLGASAVLLGYPLFTSKIEILQDIFSLKYSEPLWFLRPISPQSNHILLIIPLLLIYNTLTPLSKAKQAILVLVSGLTLGALFYTFVFYWTFIYAGLSILFVILIFKKEFLYARNIIFIVLISLLISIPYWINYWNLIHLPDYSTLEYYNVVVNSRQPLFPLFHLILAALILLTYYRKKVNLPFWYITAFLIGGILCVNQQIISGKILYPGHWLVYSNKTFAIIALFASLRNFKENYIIKNIINRIMIRRIIMGIFILLLVFLSFMQQNNSFKFKRTFYAQKQSLSDVFSWLREHSDKDSVVLTDPYNCFMKRDFPEPFDILAYTNNFCFLPVFLGTVRSTEEIEDRNLMGLAIFGYNVKEVEEFIGHANGIHFLAMRAAVDYSNEKIDKEYAASLRNKFISLNTTNGLQAKLNRYRLDYIIARKNHVKERGILKNFPDCSIVFDNGEFVVFKFSELI